MILSFKDRFVDKILSGTKIHSIRADPHRRWKPGCKIHMATGVRTKKYRCFMESTCVSVQKITIRHNEKWSCRRIWIGDYPFFITTLTKETLAENDGFGSVDDFFKWFNSDFDGYIIHWTDYEY